MSLDDERQRKLEEDRQAAREYDRKKYEASAAKIVKPLGIIGVVLGAIGVGWGLMNSNPLSLILGASSLCLGLYRLLK